MEGKNYEKNVFINCPFDDSYKEYFHAMVFTIIDCGFIPHCALEIEDGTQNRIDIIYEIIAKCKLSIHDISETNLDPVHNLPRFNMPLELGIFLGAKRFGREEHETKNCLILDAEEYRYQIFISDIKGQGISAHNNDIETLIKKIRNWLRPKTEAKISGGQHIYSRYNQLKQFLQFEKKISKMIF